MKKRLLPVALLLGLSFSAKAQEEIITSFEASESLAYTIGDDLSLYDTYWSTYSSANAGDVDSGYIVITDEWASDGSQSVQFTAVAAGESDNNILYSPTYNFSTLSTSDFQIGADFSTDDVSQTSSNLWFLFYTYDGTASENIAQVMFDYSGEIFVYDPTADQTSTGNYGYQSVGSFESAGDDTVRAGFNTDGSISYYINGDSVYTFYPDVAPDFTTSYFYFGIAVDDWGSTWYADKISAYIPTADVKEQSLSQFAVYPNPSNNIVNVSNDNALVQSVTVTDINGRTVKTAAFEGVTSAQVNISDLANGVYMMTISSDKGSVTKKVVKN